MKWASSNKGFTLVEIMIVITVIGILAAISIIYFTGAQDRARLTKAKADMEAIGEATENYITLNPPGAIDNASFAAILKSANLYDQTRQPDKSSFAFCYNSSTRAYAIAAWNPIVAGYKNKDQLYVYTSSDQQKVYDLQNSSLSAKDKLKKLCDMINAGSTYQRWSNDV